MIYSLINVFQKVLNVGKGIFGALLVNINMNSIWSAMFPHFHVVVFKPYFQYQAPSKKTMLEQDFFLLK